MNKKYALGIIVLILLSVFTFFFWPAKFNLKKGNITLNYKEKYIEPGYKVTRFGKDYTKKVKVKSNVNSKKLGTYEVTYKLKVNGITFEKVRKVTVKDKEKPKITLVGSKDTTVCPNKEYQEEGYKAIDNYDGDISKSVEVTKKENQIIYEVTDKAKNKKVVKRNLIYVDKTAPTITLKGNAVENVYLGDNYTDSGFSASDNCDGDITSGVIKTGSVNVNAVGTYSLIYTVKDKALNETKVERKVNVVNREVSIPGTIYLTFDDGPNEGTTNIILDILKQEGVKATFFVTSGGPDYLIKREYDEGHTVALHTSSHNYQTVYSSVVNYYNDLKIVQDRVKRVTGYEAKIIRFPGGSSNTISRKYTVGIMSYLTKDTISKGYRYYDWNISSGDAGETTKASGVYNNVIKNLRKNRSNVVLMHDIKTYTRDALRDIIKYGKNNGYKFEKITMSTPMVHHRVNN